MECQHINTCLACFLNDHHNREGELLLGVFVDGSTTNGDVLRELLLELETAANSIDPADMPGFTYDAAKGAAKSLFADMHPMTLDRGLFDESLDIDEDAAELDELDPASMAQAWFLFTWEKEDALS